MKYFVIGGLGFVGRYLVKALQERKDGEVIVCDVAADRLSGIRIDIKDKDSLRRLDIANDDIVINLAANQYHQKVPRDRMCFFNSVNTIGTRNLLEVMAEKGAHKYIAFSTDMTYGYPVYLPIDTLHPQRPIGPYGQSKLDAEKLCSNYRKYGMNITVFRPRMIVGPGRMGVLEKLFTLIDYNLPVPTIGSGENHYQMVSVFDCVGAILCAIDKGIPNKEYNLGSENPPSCKELLQFVIRDSGKHSIVVPTPAKIVKVALRFLDRLGLTLMYPEQYEIADQDYVLDISSAKEDLGWTPKYKDTDMLLAAYKKHKGNEER